MLSQQNLATDVSVGYQLPYWFPSIKKIYITRMKNCSVWREGKNDDDDDDDVHVCFMPFGEYSYRVHLS